MRFHLAQTAVAFDLIGVPADILTDPIILETGETFTFGMQFTGGSPGLSRGAINIASNDPTSLLQLSPLQ